MPLELGHIRYPPNVIANAVTIQIHGLQLISGYFLASLHGFEHLNKTVGTMFSDLAERVYPDLEKAAEAGKPQSPRESAL